MRAWVTFVACIVAFAFAAFSGCSSTETNSSQATVSVNAVSVASGGNACNGNQPDGYCNIRGQNPETCACVDCTESAACRMTCTDDGNCAMATGDEDCTCNDCFGMVFGCPPESVGCEQEDPTVICTPFDDCTCPECTNTPRCMDNCNNNGSCVEYLEGCSCADCNGVAENCGGMQTVSSTTTTTGGGGAGGVGGMGGAAGAGGN